MFYLRPIHEIFVLTINDININLLIMTIISLMLILTITYITCTFQPRNMRTSRTSRPNILLYVLSIIFLSNHNEKDPLTVARVDWRSLM